MGMYISRRNLIYLSCAGALACGLSACKQGELQGGSGKDDLWKTPPSSTKGLYGFIDESGDWAIKPQFKDFCFFSDNEVAPAVCKRDPDPQSESIFYSGIIDTSGRWIKEPKKSLYFSYEFSESLVGATQIKKESGYPKQDDLGGYMDTQGNWVIEPKFDLGSNKTPFSFEKPDVLINEAHAKALNVFDKSNNSTFVGVIDKRGDWIIEPKYRSIVWDSFHGELTVGLALAQDTTNKENSLWGFIDGKGNWKIQPIFKEAYAFIGDYAEVVESSTGLHGAINQDGDWVLHPEFSKLFCINQVYCTAQDPQSELYGILDFSTGEWRVKPRWKTIRRLSSTAIVAQETDSECLGVYSAIDGSTILVARYSDALYVEDRPFIAVKDRETDLWGLVGANGIWQIKPTYKDISYSSKGSLLPAQDAQTGLWGYIDESGEWVILPQFRYASSFYKGLASVSSNT